MLKLIGFLFLCFMAAIGIYTLLNSDEKEIKEAKDKIERAYDAAKKELRRNKK